MKKISIFLALLLLAAGTGSWGQGERFSTKDIHRLEKAGLITRERNDSWRTREGLIISGYDNDRKTRLEHIMSHTGDVKRKNRHGVFTVSCDRVILLMDITWKGVRSGQIKPANSGKRRVYIYDTGGNIGYLGGRDGAKKGFPALRRVRLVLEGNTPRVVTFYPI